MIEPELFYSADIHKIKARKIFIWNSESLSEEKESTPSSAKIENKNRLLKTDILNQKSSFANIYIKMLNIKEIFAKIPLFNLSF